VYVLSPVLSGRGISRANQRQRRPSGFGLVEPAGKSGLKRCANRTAIATRTIRHRGTQPRAAQPPSRKLPKLAHRRCAYSLDPCPRDLRSRVEENSRLIKRAIAPTRATTFPATAGSAFRRFIKKSRAVSPAAGRCAYPKNPSRRSRETICVGRPY
jgi:hypothetical protein